MSFVESLKFTWTRTLSTLICLLVKKKSIDLMMSKSPVWLLGLAPVVEAKHDGEGAGDDQEKITLDFGSHAGRLHESTHVRGK